MVEKNETYFIGILVALFLIFMIGIWICFVFSMVIVNIDSTVYIPSELSLIPLSFSIIIILLLVVGKKDNTKEGKQHS